MKVTGDKETIAKLLSLKSETFRRVITAVEKTAVRMANHAKAGHEQGSDPHARDRYENQTTNLTNSIFPGGANSEAMQFEEITEEKIVGLFGVDSTAPGAPMEYARDVEEGTSRTRAYPFIWPAAVANIEKFQEEIAAAAPGAKGTIG